MAIELGEIEVKIPGLGAFKLQPETAEKEAAWLLYVEFATRITAVPIERGLSSDRGSPRAALTSIHRALESARQVLRDAGPNVAKRKESLGPLALEFLNRSVRRLLDRYHAPLLVHEAERLPEVNELVHERDWDLYDAFWEEAEQIQQELVEFRDALAAIVGFGGDTK